MSSSTPQLSLKEVKPKLQPRIVVMFANFGLYHLARLNSLKQIGVVLAIEFAGTQKLYGWQIQKDRDLIRTLHQGAREEMSMVDGIRASRQLWQALDSFRPSALLIPGYMNSLSIVAAVWAKMRRSQAILMFESTERDKARHPTVELLKGLLIRALFSEAFVGGVRSSEYLQKLSFRRGKMAQKYDVVDNDFFSSGVVSSRQNTTQQLSGLPANYFLFVARLAPEKNGLGLLEAFKRYRDQGGAWEIVLVGRGDEEKKLRSFAQLAGISKVVHFVGFKNAEELWPFYAFAGCFVLPSKREPWGLVVNEAMASGLPVLVSDACGCVPDLVRNSQNGYSFDPDNIDQLASLLQRMSTLTVEARSAMGAASREIIAGYSPYEWARSVATLIR